MLRNLWGDTAPGRFNRGEKVSPLVGDGSAITMSEPAIRLMQVFKRFRRGDRYDSLRDWFAAALTPRGTKRIEHPDDFWAVNDISIAVQPGEAFGIIGPNGAGKSTLLKLLAGILRPTHGQIEVRGRVSALIELGAGFHGDLTGRENVYLNASILGMSRSEARLKFDEIVEFAGIGSFLDTPVKRYSSGMHARLGFAIAAHVNPQVLLVDEVLSVGDRVFRAKCMEKMRSFLRQGVAVVFVSHDLGAVSRFCDRALVIERGREMYCGPVARAVATYYDACSESLMCRERGGSSLVDVRNFTLRNSEHEEVSSCMPGEQLSVEMDIYFNSAIDTPSFGLSIVRSEDHLGVFETSSTRLGYKCPPAVPGEVRRIRYDFATNLLPGEYSIGFHVRDRDALTYAAQDAYAAKLMVEGNIDCGGIAHIDPKFQFSRPEKSLPRREAMRSVSGDLNA